MDKINLSIPEKEKITLRVKGADGGTNNYNFLRNKPKINEVEIIGNKEGKDYNLQDLLIPGDGIEIEDNGDHTATIKAKGDSGALAAELVVSNPIGKYDMDDVIAEGTGFEAIFREMLSKTYYPTFTAPTATLNYSVASLFKVGATIPATTATVLYDPGAIMLQGKKQADRAGASESFGFSTNGADQDFEKRNEPTGTFNVPALKRSTKGNIEIRGIVQCAFGPQPKDSDGNNYGQRFPATMITTPTKSVEFILPFYWGKKTAPSLADLSGLTEDLSKKGQKNYRYSGANNEYLYIVYDASYGNLKSILDENNFENIDSWNKSSLTVDGQNYTVYRSSFAITGNPPFTFKF